MALSRFPAKNKWATYISAMPFLPRCVRMHLAGRPARMQDRQDSSLPMPDDKKVSGIWPMSAWYLYFVLQVSFYQTMLLHRPGVMPRQSLLRACKSFRGREHRSTVLVDAGDVNGELYIAGSGYLWDICGMSKCKYAFLLQSSCFS